MPERKYFRRCRKKLPIELSLRLGFHSGEKISSPSHKRNITESEVFSYFRDSWRLAFNERGEKTVLVFIMAHNSHFSTHNVEEKKRIKNGVAVTSSFSSCHSFTFTNFQF